MATISKRRAQDPAKAAAHQDYEVRYEAKKERLAKGAIKTAVESAGSSRKKVEGEIGRH